MNFDFTEDQRLLQETVRGFLEGECTPEAIRALWETDTGRSSALWKQLAEVGLAGLLVPESQEGMGLGETDFVLLCEETGRVGLAEPVVSTAAVAAPLLRDLGGELAERWLKPLAVGEAIVAVGHPWSPFVDDAHVADLLLLFRDGELHALQPSDATLEAQPANDPARRIAKVSWQPSAETRVAEGARAAELEAVSLDRGALACAAQLLGACDRLINEAVDYTSQRQQFGVPIGSFQAVKHMLANVKVKLEYARPLVYRAAASVAEGHPQRGVHVSMAKVAATEAAEVGTRQALQAHGAIGYTWEQDLHIWMRRSWTLAQSFGLSRRHRERMAEFALGDAAPIGAGGTFGG
ncbi:MAG: acyl-CoA dehydrogenase family protein [Myxococcota bacterium]